MSLRDLRGQLPASGAYRKRTLDAIQYIVIHHSAVDVDSSAESIARYHVEALGWPGIGYSFLVHWEGRTEYTQDLLLAPYNVAGRNPEVVGICLPGDWSSRVPPQAQLEGGRSVVEYVRSEVGWEVPVIGHYEAALPGHSTRCPGDTWPQWRGRIA